MKRAAPLGCVLVYLGLCGILPCCVGLADRFILFPQPSEGAPPPAERLLVTDAGATIELWRVPHPAPKGYIVRFYGNGDLADRWVTSEARVYADLGLELWAANYPGYGMSSGPPALTGVARVAEVAFDAVKERAGMAPILVLGTSLGTTAALHVTATRPAAGVVLVNPPALRELIVGDFGWWNLWIMAKQVARQVPETLDSVANARASTCPALFVTSGRDEVVRPRYQQLVFEAYAGEKDLVARADATHNTPLDADVRDRIHAAVRRMIGG